MNNRVLTFIFAALLSVVGAKADGIPSGYFSEVASGEFYLYNVTQQQFLVRLSNNFPGMTNAPAEVKVTENGSAWTIMFSDGKYLKTGYWNNQYLWSDGDDSSTRWTLEENGDKLFYIYTNDFTETNAEVVGKTMYLQETNATSTKPSFARWALITEDDYVAWAMSGEATADPAVVAENLATIKAAKGDATTLVQNASFAKGDGGWRGGTRTLCTLYRGNGYDYESTDDNARMIQILNNMPAGTYKVVAVVRGANGTTAQG